MYQTIMSGIIIGAIALVRAMVLWEKALQLEQSLVVDPENSELRTSLEKTRGLENQWKFIGGAYIFLTLALVMVGGLCAL